MFSPRPFGGRVRSHKSVANDSGAHFSDCRAAAPSILSHQSLFHGCLTLAGFTFLTLFQGNFSATSKRSYLVGVGSGSGGGGVNGTGGLILPVGTRDWLSGKKLPQIFNVQIPRSNHEELRARRIDDLEHSRSLAVVRLRDRDDASIHGILLLAQAPHDADGVGMRLTETVSEKTLKTFATHIAIACWTRWSAIARGTRRKKWSLHLAHKHTQRRAAAATAADRISPSL